MSRPRRIVTALICAALAALALRPVHAQVAASRTDSLLRAVQALDSSLVARSRVVDSMRRALVRPVPPIDVQRGVLHVRTVAELQPRVQTAVDSVSALIQRTGSPALESRVSAHTPMIVRDSARS